MWNFLFEFDCNRGLDPCRRKESSRCQNGKVVVSLRHRWVIATKVDSLFGIVLIDPDLVAKRDWHDQGLDFVEIIVAPAQNFQGKIDLRGGENLHICHVEHIRDILGCQPKVTPRDSSTSLGMTRIADKIIVALDVATKEKALNLVEELRDQISFFKIGLQLYTAEGPEIVRAVRATGANVFLDLKLHDIPNTVARAVESAAQLQIQMLTIHLSGGEAMIQAAVSAKPQDLLLLGVTVLTSADEQTLRQIGIPDKI